MMQVFLHLLLQTEIGRVVVIFDIGCVDVGDSGQVLVGVDNFADGRM